MSVSTTSEHEVSHASLPPAIVPAVAVWLPFVVALAALAGSLWLSVGMHLKACPFCFYQRTFVMGVVAIFAVGVLTGRQHWGVLNLLALPSVIAGLGVAVFHVYLELTGKLECPGGILGIGTAPQQSLAALALLLIVVVIGLARSGPGVARCLTSVAAVVLGVLLAVASIISSPPMPPVPTKAYTAPLDICRPPFHPQ
jgi:disulfide bond formation protein DsbB